MMPVNNVIEVELYEEEGVDKLTFCFTSPQTININSCTTIDLKKVFEECLNYRIKGEIVTFNLIVDKEYKKGLFIDVFSEYIKLINEELKKTEY